MIVLLFEMRAFYLGTLEPEHDFMMKWISRTENENPGFRAQHEIDLQIPTQNEILMKTWYLLVVLAVISVFAVCRFDTTKNSISAITIFSEKSQLPGCAFFQNIGWSDIWSIPESFTSIWTSKTNPPRYPPTHFPSKIQRKFNLFFHSVFCFFHIWAPTVA